MWSFCFLRYFSHFILQFSSGLILFTFFQTWIQNLFIKIEVILIISLSFQKNLQLIVLNQVPMYEVQKIVSSRVGKNGKNEYFVKWVGYDSSQNTWQPEKHLTTVKDMIKKFNASNSNGNGNGNCKGPTTKSSSSAERKRKESDEMNFALNDESENNENDSLGSFGKDSDREQQVSEPPTQKSQVPNTKRGPIRSIKRPLESQKQQSAKKPLAIGGITTDDNGAYIYKIKIDNSTRWVPRSFLVPTYLNQLCEFYEQNLILKS